MYPGWQGRSATSICGQTLPEWTALLAGGPHAGIMASPPPLAMIVVVCALQPSSSANPGCPGPENSVPVSSRLACPISSQVTDHWVEPCNRTGEVHPVDTFHSLDNLKNHFTSIAFFVGAVIELSFVVSIKGFSSSLMGGGRLLSTLLSFMFSIAVLTNEV